MRTTPAAQALKATPFVLLGLVALVGMAQVAVPDTASASAPISEPAALEEEIRWVGCGISKKAFLSAAADAYEEETGIKVKVSGGGASKGIAAAGDGSADFGGTCRGCLTSMEEDDMKLTLSIVAWDALVPIVFPKNPVQNLTKEQVVGILKGDITDWSEVGGKRGKIEVYVRSGKTSGVGYSVRKMIFGDAEPLQERQETLSSEEDVLPAGHTDCGVVHDDHCGCCGIHVVIAPERN